MKEMNNKELMETNGGVIGVDDIIVGIAIGIGVAAGAQIFKEWDDFKTGFMSAF